MLKVFFRWFTATFVAVALAFTAYEWMPEFERRADAIGTQLQEQYIPAVVDSLSGLWLRTQTPVLPLATATPAPGVSPVSPAASRVPKADATLVPMTPTTTRVPAATATQVRAAEGGFTSEQLFTLELHNKARAEGGLPLLELDGKVSAAAQAQTDDMAARGYFAHETPEGKTPWDWMREAGARYITAGQNIGRGSPAVGPSEPGIQLLFDAMMAETPPDDGHRRSILNPAFRRIGVGVAWSAGG